MKRAIICLKAGEFGQSVLNLGRQGEDNAVRVLVDIGEYLKQDAGAQAALSAETPGGYVYPVIAAMSGTTLTWNIGESDVAEAGSGQVQLTIMGTDGEVLKSAVAMTRIGQSLRGEGEAPDQIQSWIDSVGKQLGEVVSAGKAAEEAAAKAETVAKDLSDKLDSGDFTGPQGPQGPKGDKGADWAAGANGPGLHFDGGG